MSVGMEVEDATMVQLERYCLNTFNKLTIMNQRAVVCRMRSSAHTVGFEERGAGVEYIGSKATRSRISKEVLNAAYEPPQPNPKAGVR